MRRKNPDPTPVAEAPPLRKGRAVPLPPTERRAAIIAATLPLLLANGTSVTTRQIAEAAGIAEGTIFRVFPDIESLLQATVDAAYDPASVAAELRSIAAEPFERRMILAVRILQRRLINVWQLSALQDLPKSAALSSSGRARATRPDVVALAELFEPDRHRLRRNPTAAAQLLRGLTLAGTHPALAGEHPMKAEEIVSLLLDGMRVRTDELVGV
ncbi:MAG TPA: helix-turn-helix domain-containing protein [Ilumatobacteraceae bacterium]|jgi:AcrR family transcriptional regulator